jgi:hypothetical protein
MLVYGDCESYLTHLDVFHCCCRELKLILPSSEACSRPASEEIPRVLLNLQVNCLARY